MSPIINPDTSSAVDMSPIEPGTYPAKCTNVEFGLSKKGNPMITPTIEGIVNAKARTLKVLRDTNDDRVSEPMPHCGVRPEREGHHDEHPTDRGDRKGHG